MGLAAVEPPTCSSEGQDLAEPETFYAEGAYVSTLCKFAMRVLKICSISLSLVAKSLSVFRVVWIHTGHPIRRSRKLCDLRFEVYTNSKGEHWAFHPLYFQSRCPIPSMSEPEPLGEPYFGEEACDGGIGTFVPLLTRARRKAGKLQNWVADNFGQDKTRNAREREKHRARSSRKWLEPKWLRVPSRSQWSRATFWHSSLGVSPLK